MSKVSIEDIYYHIRFPKDYKEFWNINQEFSYTEPFATFKKKRGSAKIMNAIVMVYDPKSQLANSGESEQKIKKDIAKNFLENEEFNWSEYSEIITAYKKYSKTKIEKALDDWWRDLEERRDFLQDMEFDEDPKLKDDLLLNTDKHFEKYYNIQSKLKEERGERLMRGNYTPSELEIWAINE